MINSTPRLKLPYLVESQAQKEITHNEALEIIDVLLHASVIALGENTPPEIKSTSVTRGDCYIAGLEPTGEWEDHPNALCYYMGGGWNFIEPFEGLTVWVRGLKCHYTYDGFEWVPSFRSLPREGERCTHY